MSDVLRDRIYNPSGGKYTYKLLCYKYNVKRLVHTYRANYFKNHLCLSL